MPISRSKIAALSTAVSSITPTMGAPMGVKVLHAAVNSRLAEAAPSATVRAADDAADAADEPSGGARDDADEPSGGARDDAISGGAMPSTEAQAETGSSNGSAVLGRSRGGGIGADACAPAKAGHADDVPAAK